MRAVPHYAFILLITFLLPVPVQACSLVPGDSRVELEVNGQMRSYLMHVPPQAVSGMMPVVISLHGWPGSTPALEKLLGPSTRVIDANVEIWKFFSQFSLAGRMN